MKHILITGVSSGLGEHAAKHFLKKGYSVLGSVRKFEDAKTLISEFPDQFTPLVFDVTDHLAIESAFDIVKGKVNDEGLTALINNAGMAVSGPIKHIPMDRFRHQFEVNVFGLVKVTQVFLPLLGGEAGSPYPPGRIINISSISGLIANPFMGPYSASKFAVEAISDVMRREFSIYGIKVICLQPGVIRSEIWSKARSEPRDYGSTDYDYILAKQDNIIDSIEKRAISPEFVSRAIEHAITQKRPRPRYIIAKKSWMIRLIAHIIPSRITDRIFTRNMKSDNIRAV